MGAFPMRFPGEGCILGDILTKNTFNESDQSRADRGRECLIKMSVAPSEDVIFSGSERLPISTPGEPGMLTCEDPNIFNQETKTNEESTMEQDTASHSDYCDIIVSPSDVDLAWKREEQFRKERKLRMQERQRNVTRKENRRKNKLARQARRESR